jgi:nucleotide-binding universal stress UspA family protein
MYDRVLLPTDGSEGSGRAIDLAVDTAARNDAVLEVLYVIDTHSQAARISPGMVREQLGAHGQAATGRAAERATSVGIEAHESIVEDDSPSRAIIEYADDQDCDLIVMGTHGRTGLDRVLLGSMTERVVRRAPVPVLTVGMTPEEARATEGIGATEDAEGIER